MGLQRYKKKSKYLKNNYSLSYQILVDSCLDGEIPALE